MGFIDKELDVVTPSPSHDRKYTSPDSFRSGVIAILPMLVGTAPFGIVFGALAVEVGLGAWGGQGMSLFVFAGSAQFVGASLYGQGVSILVLAVTTFFINLRHILYGASIAPKLIDVNTRSRFLMAFLLTDEAFAIVSRFEKIRANYFWGAAIAMYLNWQLWTFLGIVAGREFSGLVTLDLGYLIVPAFIAIIIPQIKGSTAIMCAIFSICLSLLLDSMPHKLGIIMSSVLAIVASIGVEKLFIKSESDEGKSKK
mgnify:FL=1